MTSPRKQPLPSPLRHMPTALLRCTVTPVALALSVLVLLASPLIPSLPAAQKGEALETRNNHYEDGRLKTRWSVKTGEAGQPIRHGAFFRYHPNGQIAVRGSYRNDEQVGIWTWWDEEGVLLRQALKQGVFEEVLKGRDLESPATIYRDPRGVKIASGQRRFDKPHGPWSFFFPDGELKAQGKYINGIPDGRWVFHFSTGQIRRREEYRLGILNGKLMRGYANGQEQLLGEMDQGLRVGKWRTWFRNGQIESSGRYEEDLPVGEWRFWDESGQLLNHVRYQKGEVVEHIPIPQPKVATPSIIENPQALPFRPRIYDEEGQPIRLRGQ